MTSKQGLAVQYRPVDDLVPYVNNSRTHSDEQVTQIASSIKEFGFTNPVLIDEDNGVIAGHGRLMAAKKLKLKDVPTIMLAGLTDAQKRAYVIADNKIALNSDWDLDLLKNELQVLDELDFNSNLLGFDADELNVLMQGWDSDIDVLDKHGETLEGILSKITVRTSSDNEDFAKEVITNALDSAGIEYEF